MTVADVVERYVWELTGEGCDLLEPLPVAVVLRDLLWRAGLDVQGVLEGALDDWYSSRVMRDDG